MLHPKVNNAGLSQNCPETPPAHLRDLVENQKAQKARKPDQNLT